MQVVILAGGLATRLRPLLREKPKSMVEVLGKPFLEYQLELLKGNGIRDVVLCIGHLGGQIVNHFGDGRKYGVNLKYSDEGENLMGTAGALRNAESLLDDVFLTMYGDSYLILNFAAVMSYFQSQDKLAVMTVYKNCDRYGRSNTVVEGNMVKEFSNTEKTEGMIYAEYGVNVFKKEIIGMIPKNQRYSLDKLFPRLIEQEELLAFEVKERFYEVGTPQRLRECEEFIRSRAVEMVAHDG